MIWRSPTSSRRHFVTTLGAPRNRGRGWMMARVSQAVLRPSGRRRGVSGSKCPCGCADGWAPPRAPEADRGEAPCGCRASGGTRNRPAATRGGPLARTNPLESLPLRRTFHFNNLASGFRGNRVARLDAVLQIDGHGLADVRQRLTPRVPLADATGQCRNDGDKSTIGFLLKNYRVAHEHSRGCARELDAYELYHALEECGRECRMDRNLPYTFTSGDEQCTQAIKNQKSSIINPLPLP